MCDTKKFNLINLKYYEPLYLTIMLDIQVKLQPGHVAVGQSISDHLIILSEGITQISFFNNHVLK